MSEADMTWRLTLTFVFIAFAYAGVMDFLYYVRQVQTLTAYLRANPAWFWVPFAVLQASLFALIFHLFGAEE